MSSRTRTWGAVAVLVLVVSLAMVLLRHREPSTTSPTAAGSSAIPQASPGGGDALAPSKGVVGSVANVAPSSSAHAVLTFAPWGSGVGELGRKRPMEANPEAPMSLTADASGRIIVLDQVNGRLVRLDKDGKTIDTIALPVRAAQDVAAAKDGSLAVLDRLGDKRIALLGPDGKVRGSLPLEGKGIAEGGGVTGVFVDGDDVYAEREHGQLVLIGNVLGTPSTERTEIPGRPTRDGHAFVSAFLGDPRPTDLAYLTMNERPSMSLRFTRKVSLPVAATGIALLDTDRAGIVYLGILSAREVAVLCIDGTNGALLGTTTLPPNDMPEETFRDFAVLDAGGFVYSARDERGVTLMRGDCRSP